jgi:hypothetical protein
MKGSGHLPMMDEWDKTIVKKRKKAFFLKSRQSITFFLPPPLLDFSLSCALTSLSLWFVTAAG